MRILLALLLAGCTANANRLNLRTVSRADIEKFDQSEFKEDWVLTESTKGDGTLVQMNLGDIVLEPLPEVGRALIGGQPALAGEFPATVYATMGGARCTGNVVGEQVLLIAAHCVGDGQEARFKVAEKQYSSRCKHAPDYRRNETADWALCKTTEVISGIKFEVVNHDPTPIKVDAEIQLTGYGCTSASGGGSGGNDGVLRQGFAKIKRIPSGTNYDIVTQGSVALCFGDSGGPAYVYLDSEKKKRVQVSVNSRGDIRTTSYLSATHAQPFRDFADSWLVANAVAICGLTPEAKGCRNEEVEPNPGELPEWCGSSMASVQRCLWGNPPEARSNFEGCKDQYANLFACLELAARGG